MKSSTSHRRIIKRKEISSMGWGYMFHKQFKDSSNMFSSPLPVMYSFKLQIIIFMQLSEIKSLYTSSIPSLSVSWTIYIMFKWYDRERCISRRTSSVKRWVLVNKQIKASLITFLPKSSEFMFRIIVRLYSRTDRLKWCPLDLRVGYCFMFSDFLGHLIYSLDTVSFSASLYIHIILGTQKTGSHIHVSFSRIVS